MAKAKKTDKDSSKWKKKKWMPIIGPEIFNKAVLGETSVYEPSKAVGKPVQVNLMSLTGESRNQNVNIRFRVHKVAEGNALAEMTGYVLSASHIKRIVRRRQSRVDATVQITTKDGRKLAIKPMIVTRSKATRSAMSALRNQAALELGKAAESLTYNELCRGIIGYRLQSEMRRQMSKISPLKVFEIKKMALVA